METMAKIINALSALTAALQEFTEQTSNECDMLNRIVIGMTAKQFRIAHGIEGKNSIRPYLTQEQIDLLEVLQKVDIGLLVSVPDYHERKRHLEWYAAKIRKEC